MCTPARAQLMTGRNALSLGMVRNVKPRDDAALPGDAATVAVRLRETGYRTALVGKWHLGHGKPADLPSARGFDASYGHLRGWIDYYTHEVDGIRDWHRNGEPLDEPGYSTALIAGEACRVIEGHDVDTPLFLVVSFNAPHTPLQPPPDSVAARPGEERKTYGAMVEHLDRGIGDVLDALERKGLDASAIVWFLSDNGANLKYGGSNGALREGKYTSFDGALRIPACVRWPDRIRSGTSAEFIGTIDVAPTLLALGGAAPIQDADGVDVTGPLCGGTPAASRDFLFAVDHARVQRRAVLRPPYKLIEEERAGEATSRWIYDVANDPEEERDLSGTAAVERVGAELASRLREAR